MERRTRYHSVVRIDIGGVPRYKGMLWVGKVGDNVGHWPTAREAAIARDRLILHLGLARPLALPTESKRLGPASLETLRALAREARVKRGWENRFLGVIRNTRGNGWAATICGPAAVLSERSRSTRIGAFLTEEEAALAYDRVARHLYGDKAVLNFPDRPSKPATIEELRSLARRRVKEQKTSRYFGVFFAGDTKPHPWVVRYRPEGTSAADSPYLGNWQTERDAAIAYDRAALFFGDKPRNFPGKKLEPADPKQLQWLAHQPIKEAQTSKFLGVSWATQSEKWIAGIGHDRKHHFLGSYDNEEDAARARDSAAIRLCDLPVKLNFQPVTGKPLYGEMYDGPIPANFGVRQRKKKKTVAR